MQRSLKHFILISLTILLSQVNYAQFKIPELPDKNKQTSVYDSANLLNNYEKNYLEEKLIKYADSTSTQIVIATVPTLNGDDISLTATQWAHQWGVGQADKDNGVFILVASEDREIDISTGYGIEYRLTDLMAERILNRIILPEFKRGDYFSGLHKGTDAIIAALNGEFKATQKRKKKQEGFHNGLIILLGTMFFVILLSILSKGKRNDDDDYKGGKRPRGLSPFEMIILSSGGRSYGGGTGSFGGGGFSGGGFSGGFGGGGFGGGGASGSW